MTQTPARNRSRGKWLVALLLLVSIACASLWFFRRPKLVTIVHPVRILLTETIASSARVGGVQESAVGAQFSGTVERLFVRIGDTVKAGQPIATLRNDVTQQQKEQARVAVGTARAQLAEANQALQVAVQQSKEATITAPFAGVITALNAEEGQTVGSNGGVMAL